MLEMCMSSELSLRRFNNTNLFVKAEDTDLAQNISGGRRNCFCHLRGGAVR